MRDVLAGHWYISQTAYGPMVHAKLGTAQENSGKLVAQIRQRAKAIAAEAYPLQQGCPISQQGVLQLSPIPQLAPASGALLPFMT